MVNSIPTDTDVPFSTLASFVGHSALNVTHTSSHEWPNCYTYRHISAAVHMLQYVHVRVVVNKMTRADLSVVRKTTQPHTNNGQQQDEESNSVSLASLIHRHTLSPSATTAQLPNTVHNISNFKQEHVSFFQRRLNVFSHILFIDVSPSSCSL